MNDPSTCEKHKFEIVGAVDQFLWGWVYFQCVHCKIPAQADRFYLYMALKGRT